MTLLSILVVAVTAIIAILCYVWMMSTRASQSRMEQHYQRMVALLEEQNAILRKLAEKQ